MGRAIRLTIMAKQRLGARVETDRFQAGTRASATIEDKKVTSTSIL